MTMPTSGNADSFVEISNLKKVYADTVKSSKSITALEDVSLTVSKGEFLSIVGPSDCGKSTLLYCKAMIRMNSIIGPYG